MKLGTVIKIPDGRIGTVCWNHLDGSGGVWGVHEFEMPVGGFGDLPKPEFMLREKVSSGGSNLEQILRASHESATLECVGGEFEVIEHSDKGEQCG